MPSLIPKSSYEVRPRLAVEVRSDAVIAARASDASGALAQVAQVALPVGAVFPSLRVGNLADRVRVASAMRVALSQLQLGKLRDVSLIVPDATARVLLLDFDTMPTDREDALAVIRFRLSKLLPFPAEAAQVSYQVMAERGRQLQVLTVAMPYEVLAEYESAVRDAGYEPGAVLTSTLAAASAVDDAAQTAALLVNTSPGTLTTAILRRGEMLLHRTLETEPGPDVLPHAVPADAIAVLPTLPGDVTRAPRDAREYGADDVLGDEVDEGAVVEAFVPAREFAAAQQQAAAIELQRAVAVTAAYYEDSLAVPPSYVLTAGSLSAQDLAPLLAGMGLEARELLQAGDVLSTATTPVAPGMLAGVRGALRNDARAGGRR